MIPSSFTRRGAIVLRSLRGRFDAAWQTSARSLSAAPTGPDGLLVSFVGLLVRFAPAIILVALLVAAGHFGLAGPFALAAGPTTGTKSSGSDFVGMNDMLKERYTKAFDNNLEKESEVSDIFTRAEGFEVVEGPDGKGINIGHIFSSGGGVGSMLEDDYLYTPTAPTNKTSKITIKQHEATVQLSGRTLRRVKSGPAAFVTWATEALPRKAQRLAFMLDRQRLGTGTGIICRYNGTPDGTGDGIDNMFGISGLDDRADMLLLRDDNIRVGPNADGTSLRTGTALIGAVNKGAHTIDTTVAGSAAAPTSAADNDYIFNGDTNVNGSGSREMMGLEGIIDDGTNLTTFQGLTRSSYPELSGQIIDASLAPFDSTLTEDILDYADSLTFERGNGGRPMTVLVNRLGAASFWRNMKNDRTINDPAGVFTGGKAKLRMMLTDRVVTLQSAAKVPGTRAYGIDGTGIQRYIIGDGHWDDTDGSIWNRVVDGTGRKDAFFAVYVKEEEMGASNPAGSFKIINITG